MEIPTSGLRDGKRTKKMKKKTQRMKKGTGRRR